jgi:hypothetical protein
MLPVPKNTTKGYTESWKRERERLMKYYQQQPYYGSSFAEPLYTKAKQVIPALIQASHCGPIVQLTTYKQDADKARSILYSMFKTTIKQTTCPYTDYVTTFVINRNKTTNTH